MARILALFWDFGQFVRRIWKSSYSFGSGFEGGSGSGFEGGSGSGSGSGSGFEGGSDSFEYV